jgi:hypothetical protein
MEIKIAAISDQYVLRCLNDITDSIRKEFNW